MGLGDIFLVASQPPRLSQVVPINNLPVVLRQNLLPAPIPHDVIPVVLRQGPLPAPISKTFEEYCVDATSAFLDEHLNIGQKKLLNVHHILIYLKGDLLLLKRMNIKL